MGKRQAAPFDRSFDLDLSHRRQSLVYHVSNKLKLNWRITGFAAPSIIRQQQSFCQTAALPDRLPSTHDARNHYLDSGCRLLRLPALPVQVRILGHKLDGHGCWILRLLSRHHLCITIPQESAQSIPTASTATRLRFSQSSAIGRAGFDPDHHGQGSRVSGACERVRCTLELFHHALNAAVCSDAFQTLFTVDSVQRSRHFALGLTSGLAQLYFVANMGNFRYSSTHHASRSEQRGPDEHGRLPGHFLHRSGSGPLRLAARSVLCVSKIQSSSIQATHPQTSHDIGELSHPLVDGLRRFKYSGSKNEQKTC